MLFLPFAELSLVKILLSTDPGFPVRHLPENHIADPAADPAYHRVVDYLCNPILLAKAAPKPYFLHFVYMVSISLIHDTSL
jgi:hypothetical protein